MNRRTQSRVVEIENETDERIAIIDGVVLGSLALIFAEIFCVP